MKAWMSGGVALLAGAIFVAALSLPGIDGALLMAISDVGQLAAAVAGAAACWWAARRRHGRERRVWSLLAAGTGSWATGQLVWTYYEVVLGVEVPFPSLADVGFLLFPVFATLGLSSWHGAPGRVSARGRDLLDGVIIGGSLLVVSWSTALGSVLSGGGDAWLPLALSLAYPLGDVVLLTVVFLILGHIGAQGRSTLILVASGLGSLAVADSAYVYLVATGSYSSGDLVSSGWVFGFLLIAAGAVLPARDSALAGDRPVALQPVVVRAPSRLRMMLPYIPLLAAMSVSLVALATAPVTSLVDLVLVVVLVTLVLLRQFLAMNENHRLLGELEETRDQLQHQTLHDPLTGLANRTLFADRLEQLLAQRSVDLGLLYCDLDDFKSVNDKYGHHAGDQLLCTVAERLLECVRPSDTVARLGGDEFAVLLGDSNGISAVAERIVYAVKQPWRIGEISVRTSVSVGIAYHQGVTEGTHRDQLRATTPMATASAERLLQQADAAMYAVKVAGKGRALDSLTAAAPGLDPLAISPAS
ncbi:MAG TPA: GGDEF domain-containing protein [Nocardioidaceae bacterium]|nr:GGDEF domain-containing protein [Nocardioidaceae bacterium]